MQYIKALFKSQNKKRKFDIREFFSSILVALIIAILIRSFIFEPFRIPSGSMYPTLKTGDVLVVNKFSYGYSRHSLPWSVPIIPHRIFYTPPKRGDIIVVKVPEHPKRFFIKRLIGLPGDTVQMIRGNLYINGKAVKRKYLGGADADKHVKYISYITEYQETLPNNVTYKTWSLEKVRDQLQPPQTTDLFVIPEDKFFFVGDNRDNSADSRDAASLGLITKDQLLGKASFIVLSLNSFNRFFKSVY